MLLPFDPLLRLRLGTRQIVARLGTLLVVAVCGAGATAADGGGASGWVAGLVVTAVVLGAFVLHLFARLLAGRRLRFSPRRAHLTVFGCIPDSLDDAETPRAEALIGSAGLAAIVGLAGIAAALDAATGDPPGLTADPVHTAAMALVGLAAVQAMPGLTLDGGRLWRGLVWYLTDNPVAGARAAAIYAQLVSVGMIVFGIVALTFTGALPFWGLWAMVGGWQLGSEARAARHGLRWQRLARSTPIGDLAVADRPPTLPGGATIDAALEPLIEGGGDVPFLVLDAERRPIGVLRLANLRGCPRTEWVRRTVADVATPIGTVPQLGVDRSARDALALLDELEAHGAGRGGGPLVVVAADDVAVAVFDRRRILLKLLAVDRQPGGDSPAAAAPER